MNGLITNNCCCDSSPCCGVGGSEPYWYNQYCFQLSQFQFLYRMCECNDFLDPCNRCAEPADCNAQIADPVTGHPPCIECCREIEVTLCASGALFRHPYSIPNCQTSAQYKTPEWASICSTSPYEPPNYDSSVGGVTSYYTSPPCDCVAAANDRLTWIGRVRNEDVNGCCDSGDYDEPVNCISGHAYIECEEAPCDTTSYPCCTLDPTAPRTHYLRLAIDPGLTYPPWGSCNCGGNTPSIEFTFAAQLGPEIGPHMASWTLIGVSGPYRTPCLYPNGFLPCTIPECCDPSSPDPCCVGDCGEWSCELCAQGTCSTCVEASYSFPSITLTPYQNCVAPSC